jgi:hypothetical protein
MSEPLSDTQRVFLETFLGVSISNPAAEGNLTTVTVWNNAKDRVDDQLRSLSDKLRKSALPQVQGVADEVETLLGPLRVNLIAALQNLDAAPGDAKAQGAARKAVGSARAWLDSDARVRAIDTNPWKVPVSVAATLGQALDRLETQLEKMAGAGA